MRYAQGFYYSNNIIQQSKTDFRDIFRTIIDKIIVSDNISSDLPLPCRGSNLGQYEIPITARR